MSKILNIEFAGGFHGYTDVTVRAKIIDRGSYLGAYISAGQARKLAREFCGMTDCRCGGVYRANMSAPTGWEPTTEGSQDGGLLAYRNKNS